MLPWLRAIARETAPAVLALLSGLSTLATFFFPKLAGYPRGVLAACFVAGFAWANLRVFQKQQAEIARLTATLRLVQQTDEQDRIRDLQELRAAIADALDLARTWMQHVPMLFPRPHAIPDPSQITQNRLLDVRSHARRISPHCERLVFDAHTALRNARAQFEKLRQATHDPFILTGNPQPFLDAAYESLLEARRIVDTLNPQAPSEGQAEKK